jgi:hypothetical protein
MNPNQMHWTECTQHTSVCYDSSFHKSCPACLNDILNEALSRLNKINAKHWKLELSLIQLAKAINQLALASSKDEANQRAEAKFTEVEEMNLRLKNEMGSYVEYMLRNNLSELLFEII